MAHKSPLSTIPNTPLLNGQDVDGGTNAIERQSLPSGGCNFTILSAVGGGIGTKCGCRRYWDKSGHADREGFATNSGYCMCEHHACFHEHDSQGRRNSRTPSDVQANPLRSGTLRKQETITHGAPDYSKGISVRKETISRQTARESSTPDTLQWSRYIHSGTPDPLPAIPSQCLLPSENGSLASGSQSRYTRPFGGTGLNTLSQFPKPIFGESSVPKKPQPLGENMKAMQVYEDAHGNPFLQSITEKATSSTRVSPEDTRFGKNIEEVQEALDILAETDPQAAESFRACAKESTSSQIVIKKSDSHPSATAVSMAKDNDDYLVPRLRSILARIARFPNTVEGHARRLEDLENGSFTNPAVEDLQEGHTLMDIRLSELENRLDEVEKAQTAQADVSSVGSVRNAGTSFDSRISTTSSAMIAQAIDNVDFSRITALEAQVAELQSLVPPSHARPWQIEVVFLPFGSNLKGIWSSHHSRTQLSRTNSSADDAFTQAQNQSLAAAQASLATHEQSSAWEQSTADVASDEDAPWLTAKACGSASRVDQRLRSRGLVKLVEVKGPDARDVQAAMMVAFGNLPDLLVEDPFTHHEDDGLNTIPGTLSQYIGLQALWVPLRKVHKHSTLRFLSTSEMVTPALWTVQFLASSVAMRTSGLRRLYVTQRDSYIQHHGDPADWTWQKLRQLPRVYPDQPSQGHTPEADAHEPCWEFDERLDPAPLSVHSSFQSQVSSLSIRSVHYEEEPVSPSDHFSSAAVSPENATTPTSFEPVSTKPLSPLMERNPFKPIHKRTASMQSIVPLKSPAQSVKRRVTSFERETQPSPTPINPAPSGNLALKRRRLSRSPSRPRDTPRWSNGPPSPCVIVEETSNKRCSTPFAYATPHSNAPYVDTRPKSTENIEIWEDNNSEEEHGSATNVTDMNDNGNDSEGWDQNALSDFEPDFSEQGFLDGGDHLPHQHGDEWQGVGDDIGGIEYDSQPSSFGVSSKCLVESLRPDIENNHDDARSDASSQPSEYPSTQQGLLFGPKAGFKIHVDEEIEEV